MLGDHGDGTIGAAHDGAFMVKGIGTTEVNHEAGVFGATHKSDCGADLNAEGLVGLGIGDARGSGGVGALVALDVYGAGRRDGAASVGSGANAGGIGGLADVILDFLFAVLANNKTGHEKRQNEHTSENCEIAVNFH